MFFLKQSTAVTVVLGPMLDSTDGITAESGLTLSQSDIRLSKNGGSFAQANEATSATHMENGYYSKPLSTTDTNTLGILNLAVAESGALPIWHDFMIVPANVWDSLFGADLLDVSLVQIAGDAQSSTDLKDFADAGYDPATNKVEGVKLADALTTYTSNTPQTGDSFARIGATGSGLTSLATQASVNTIDGIVDDILVDTGTTLQGELDGIQADTEDIQARLPAALVGGRIDATLDATGLEVGALALINAEVDTALADYDGPTFAELDARTDAIDAAIAALSIPSAAVIADAVWDEDATGHQTQGSFGQAIGDPVADADTIWGLVNTNLNATVSSRASQSSVDDLPTNAELATALGTADDAVLAAVAAVQADTDDLQTKLAIVDGIVDDILVDTAVIGAAGAGLTALATQASVDTIDGIVDAILVDTAVIGALGAGLTAVPWNAAWDAEVQSEVQDAIEVNHLDHLLAVTYDPAAKPGAADALLNELVESDAGVARYTANALEQAPTGGSAPTAAAIADAVWEEALADHEGTAGSVAEALADAGGSGASAADIADAVWDEATAGHTTGGTFGEQVKTDVDAILADTGTDGVVLANDAITAAKVAADVGTEIASAVRTNLTTELGRIDAAVTTRATPAQVATELATYDGPTHAELVSEINAVQSDIAAIEAQTDDIGVAGAGLTAVPWNAAWDAEVQSEVADALTAYDPPTHAELTTALGTADDAVLAAIAALNNLSTAQLAAALATYDGPTKAELDAAVALLATAANLALVKAKTDSLTFTVAGVVDSNLQRVNDVALVGSGVLGDEWGPA